ncbi:MAG: hypothetical protein HKP51_09960 [Sulfitobacter sp.]|nr:hypothetical protein [Sulfitobacter sp.]
MSSILLNNPFTAPQPVANLPQDAAAALQVAPTQAASRTPDSGDASSFTGSGSGTGTSNQGNTVALLQSRDRANWGRPTDATGGSVIGAQAQEYASEPPFGVDLPKVEMPDPLPTSPFLKGAQGDA